MCRQQQKWRWWSGAQPLKLHLAAQEFLREGILSGLRQEKGKGSGRRRVGPLGCAHEKPDGGKSLHSSRLRILGADMDLFAPLTREACHDLGA